MKKNIITLFFVAMALFVSCENSAKANKALKDCKRKVDKVVEPAIAGIKTGLGKSTEGDKLLREQIAAQESGRKAGYAACEKAHSM